jgi:hypothetical protein
VFMNDFIFIVRTVCIFLSKSGKHIEISEIDRKNFYCVQYLSYKQTNEQLKKENK